MAVIAPLIVAGEIGVIIEILVNDPINPPANPVSIAGALAVNLEVLYPDLLTRTVLSFLPSVDGSFAYRSTLATDFPVPGTYELELVVNQLDGSLLKSNVLNLNVGGLC